MHPNGELAACRKQNLELQPKPFQIETPSRLVTVNNVIEALRYIKPMTHLMKVDGEQIYRIAPLEPPRLPLDDQGNSVEPRGRCKGGAHEIQLTTGCSSAYLESVLSGAYRVLSFKTVRRRRVEFHVTAEGGCTVEWALENCPHLRPEIILAAMPAGTLVLAPPLADGRTELMWALHRARTALDVEEKPAGRTAKGFMKGATTTEVDENEAEELEARDLKTGTKDVSESNTDRRRAPPSVLVGDGTDVDKSQVPTDVSRSESTEVILRNRNLRLKRKYEEVWNEPSQKFKLAWERSATPAKKISAKPK